MSKSNRIYFEKPLNLFFFYYYIFLLTVAHHVVGLMFMLVYVFYEFIRNSATKCNWSLLQLPFLMMAFKGVSGYNTHAIYVVRVLLKRQIPVLSSKQSKHSLFSEQCWRMARVLERRGGDIWRTSGCH